MMERQFHIYVVKSVTGYGKPFWVRITKGVFVFKCDKYKKGFTYLGKLQVAQSQRAVSKAVILK